MLTQTEQIKDLKEFNDELENYFRNTIIPQLFIDGELRLQKFTPPAMKQFSLSDNDLGKPISEIKDNFRFPSIEENIQHVIGCNEILEKEIQTTDLRWYQMNIIPYVRLKDNRTDGVIITFVEITTRIKDLQELEKLLTDHEILLDTISHDVKNPLTTLVMAFDLLRAAPPDDQAKFQKVLKNVDNALSRMTRIITELTEVRKKEHKYKSESELLNFEHVLEDVRLTLSHIILNAEASIVSEIGISEMFFSRRKLRSIIYNLVNNAIKFRSPDRRPEIRVTTREDDGNVIITVSDNGIGIPEDKIHKIFSKYYRVENNIEGSGIGLYLVKEIVNHAGGHISVKSDAGNGSEFLITLKLDRQTE